MLEEKCFFFCCFSAQQNPTKSLQNLTGWKMKKKMPCWNSRCPIHYLMALSRSHQQTCTCLVRFHMSKVERYPTKFDRPYEMSSFFQSACLKYCTKFDVQTFSTSPIKSRYCLIPSWTSSSFLRSLASITYVQFLSVYLLLCHSRQKGIKLSRNAVKKKRGTLWLSSSASHQIVSDSCPSASTSPSTACVSLLERQRKKGNTWCVWKKLTF